MNVGKDGVFENASEHTGDLASREKVRTQEIAFRQLKTALVDAFSAPDESYKPLSAAAVIERNQHKRSEDDVVSYSRSGVTPYWRPCLPCGKRERQLINRQLRHHRCVV
jgi:hypothetical protein